MESSDAQLQDASQNGLPPFPTSLDPRLTFSRPYADLPDGGPHSGPGRLPRFTPRGNAAPGNAGAPLPMRNPPPGWQALPAGPPPGRAPGPPPPAAMGGHRQPPVRAVIGDEIRIPFIWCEFGTCDATYMHPDALGERDLRARALAAGWRYDALGRRACPKCTQHDPTFWPARPPAPVPTDWRRAG